MEQRGFCRATRHRKACQFGGGSVGRGYKTAAAGQGQVRFAASANAGTGCGVAPGRQRENLKQRAGAHYWLCGRWNGTAADYAWVLPDATEDSVRAISGQLALPSRSDWIAGGSSDAETQSAATSLNGKARYWRESARG
jgi:hypothetical protein